MSDFVPLAEVVRGDSVESIHYGAVAVVDTRGRLLARAGNPHRVTFTRSSCKPFQAMPMVAAGGMDRFGFSTEQLAVMCASHNGEAAHRDTVQSILDRIGRTEADLMCGSHVPYDLSMQGKMVVDKRDFSPILNNCSGKHSGMLAYCQVLDAPHATYLEVDHPVQQNIKKCVSYFMDAPEESMGVGTDGCSVPNYALPLSGLARGFARLALREPDEVYGDAPAAIFNAMTSHPHLVSGERRGDLAIMTTGGGDWVSKVGGEAIKGIGIRSRGMGIAIKIGDGNTRSLVAVAVDVLRQLDLLKAAAGTPLEPFAQPVIKNHRDIVTGFIAPVVKLERVASGVASGEV
jgi:L-asparaginase II